MCVFPAPWHAGYDDGTATGLASVPSHGTSEGTAAHGQKGLLAN